MKEDPYYLDLSDEGPWLIRRNNPEEKFTAGFDKEKAMELIEKLNGANRPNVENREINEIWVCWNNHDKWDDCDYVREI